MTGTPVLVAVKLANPPAAAPGDTVIFTIVLENHGNGDLFNVRIVDPLIGLDQFIGDIPAGMGLVIDWPFVIPPDAQAGLTISNIVTITADNLSEPEEVGTAVEVLPVPRLEIFKSADRSVVPAGETVHFTIEVVNTGNADLANVRVTDDLTGFEALIPILFVGQREVFSVPFFVPLETPPQTYVNTAAAVSDQTEPVFSITEVTVLADPRLGIDKIPETASVAPGQTIQYVVRLENIGNVPLTGIRIVDPTLGIDRLEPDLQVGEVRELVFAFVVPRDTPVGSDLVNILSVLTAETGPQEVESLVTVTGLGLTLSKESDRAAAAPGETVFYTLTVTNLLNAPQTNIALNDPVLGLSETIPALLPGETITRTLAFTVPAGAEAGSVILNTFTVSSDQTPTLETIAEVVVLEPPGPSLAIEKTPDRNAAAPGDTVAYTLTVTNLLGVPQTNVALIDALLGLSETVASLPANGTITRTLTFAVPADAEIGSVILNTFTVSSDQTPTLEAIAEVAVEAPPGPSLLIQKLPDRNAAAPGDTVVYTLTVTNLLPIPLTNVVLTDALLGLNETLPVLPPNAAVTRTLTFVVPADAAIGSAIVNTFTAVSDQTPEHEAVAEVIVAVPPGPSLLVHKLPDRNTAAPGDTVTYTLTVTNLLGVPQTNVVLTDTLLGLSETIASLPANATITRTVTFVVPADAAVGSVIRNTFIASSDLSPPAETIAEVTVQAPPGLSLRIRKLPDRNAAAPGETVAYTLTVTNLLDIPQTNVVLSDPLLGLSETIASLPANATITRTVTFVVPADAAIGSAVVNTFTAASDQTPAVETIAEVIVRTAPVATTTLAVRKRLDRSDAEPGETIRYTVEVANTGENPATDVVVRDSLTGEQRTIPVIAPGETEIVSFAFTVPAGTTQGTVIANRVTVAWPEQPPGSPPVRDEARVIVAVPAELPEVEVDARPEDPRPGETVIKTVTVANVTNLALTNVRVFDPLVGFRTVIPLLAPGERRVFTLQLPIPAGTEGATTFRNTVSVFSDQTPLQQEEVAVRTQALPDASLTETVDRAVGRPGETVIFTIQARNTGNVPLLNARLSAPLLGIQLRIAEFDVGASETLRVPFVLPDVEEDTVIVSPVTLVSDNGPVREASASVKVLAEEEE
ncbi:DUF11 domain-containing protein [Cohnella xylanilytica]|uniref:DUF11 domain-containing protein n=1 Tax=Cohnella xylanilytica TaxID=557555 RepID=A0A841TTZ8_9BACL|nr:CARDB domain-containing protein [Cohnella xylanilytica]MBB6690382.1 DUF11 domain-containing protein [Cohnella xylanilytica]